jgi:hypothetical protein
MALIRIICGQALAEGGTEEELKVQLGYVSTIRFTIHVRGNCYTTLW